MILRQCDIRKGSIELTAGKDMLLSSYLTGVTIYIVGSDDVSSVADGCIFEKCKIKQVKKSCKK